MLRACRSRRGDRKATSDDMFARCLGGPVARVAMFTATDALLRMSSPRMEKRRDRGRPTQITRYGTSTISIAKQGKVPRNDGIVRTRLRFSTGALDTERPHGLSHKGSGIRWTMTENSFV